MSDGTADRQLRERARAVIPGGMYGHQAAPGAAYPQFMRGGRGARVWDADGNEYVDLMCSYGPVVLGHQHPKVEAAARAQAETGDCMNAPDPVMVDLAELLTQTVRHADWAILAKNGTDATTICCTIARAQTGRSKILVAKGAYHGAAPWCTPRPAGVTPADHANLGHYTFNDLASAQRAAAEAGDDLAGILVSPFKHDAGFDQELVDPAFARGLRTLCDEKGAALILDDVRAGFRLHLGSSWEPVGVDPDLSAWSKAIANGRALAAVLGSDALRDGIVDQARSWDLAVNYTGPPVMPYLTFAGDRDHQLAGVFAAQALRGGAYLHPRHNWFVSAAMTGDDLALVLEATDQAFAAVRKHLGQLAGDHHVRWRSRCCSASSTWTTRQGPRLRPGPGRAVVLRRARVRPGDCYAGATGLIQRTSLNRAKSASLEQTSSPCSMASAARCASLMMLPASLYRVIRSVRIRACPGPSRGIQATSGSSQPATKLAACSGVRGRAEARSCVLIRRKAPSECQGRATRRSPLSCSVSQWLARSWKGLTSSTA